MLHLVEAAYFLTAFLFILGLKQMASPKTARQGIVWAGRAMLLAVLVTVFAPGLHNLFLILTAALLGAAIAWIAGKRVPMTDMPQMIALYNGMGGGAAAAIAAVELGRGALGGVGLTTLAVVGGLIGAIAFSGSLIAFAKLQQLMRERPIIFPQQQLVNGLVFAAACVAGTAMIIGLAPAPLWSLAFFSLALLFGILMTLPIGGGDMPVLISLYNALTGMAVGFEGFAMQNAAMIVAGTVVGAAGTLLTVLMARAMNRSISNVLFGAFGQESAAAVAGTTAEPKTIDLDDAAILLAYASKVVIATGYGMAIAQAQHKIRELADQLIERGVIVKYAIHPVAGRMPGHMNVLLAEAGVPYEQLFDLEEINPEFPTADVSLVLGANDVVNPAARHNQQSPIYGMPILDVDRSKTVVVVKRGKGRGFAGIDNELFTADNTRMLYGDAQQVANHLVQALKRL